MFSQVNILQTFRKLVATAPLTSFLTDLKKFLMTNIQKTEHT